MTRDELLAELTALLETDAPLTGPETLANFAAWDSVAVISFIAMVDEKSGVNLPPKKILACKTIDDLAALACS